MFKEISSGIDQAGLDAKRCQNLAHAAPMDSFSNCSNARMSFGERLCGTKKRTRDKNHLGVGKRNKR